MPVSSRLALPGGRASVPKPPVPRPTEPRPADPAVAIAAQREAAARHHFALLTEAERTAAERVLAGGTVRGRRRHASGHRHLLRWAELVGRYAWIGGELWGNPFRPWREEGRRPTAEELVASHARYRAHVLASPALMARLPELRGKVLACACPPDAPCHGDVLLELLEGEA
jgi:hypothetical protein